MGAKDEELVRIAAAGRFSIPALSELRNALIALAATMNRVAASPGWKGLSADAASDKMIDLRNQYFRIEKLAEVLQGHLDDANAVRERALNRHAALPGTRAPDWVHNTLDAFDFPGIPQPVDVAQGGLAIIENFLAGEREKVAAAIVAEYERGLRSPAMSTERLSREVAAEYGRDPAPDPAPDPVPDPGGTGIGGYAPGGYGSGGYPKWTGPSAPFGGYTDPDVLVGIDDPNTGTIPGAPGGHIEPGLGGGGAGVSAGAGAGVALTAASTAAAIRVGAGAGMRGAAGAAGRLGTGGLLGAGTAGAPGAAAAAKSSTAAGARGGGSGMLGGGGAGVGGANAGDKKRRAAGKGLGGPMAPKLDRRRRVRAAGAGCARRRARRAR